MKKINLSPFCLCDFYKVSHVFQYPDNTTKVYSNFTPRKSRIKNINETIFFGLQGFIKDYLINYFNENFFFLPKNIAIDNYKDVVEAGLGPNAITYTHIEKLHTLGYLPIKIKALPEGTLVPMRVPVLTIVNTHPDFYWLPNFLETLMSAQLWQSSTSATLTYKYRQILDKYAAETSDIPDFVDWQGHDFSFRGMSSVESAILSGAGHLLSFTGTDTVPTIPYLIHNYNAKITDLIGGSVPATEHSVMCAGEKDDELGTFKRLLNKYPKGILSVVSDTWDLWKVLTEYLPTLKDEILARDGKLVIRPDSGDPVDIICGQNIKDVSNDKYCPDGLESVKEYMAELLEEEVRDETPHGECGQDSPTKIYKYLGKYYKITLDIFWNRYDKQYYFIDGVKIIKFEEIEATPVMKGVIELLYDVFGAELNGNGGYFNSKGYIQLNSHIGAIYGDSITPERAIQICERLKSKGFASTNVVFGIGSYTYQYNTRDTFGWAMKATYVEVKELTGVDDHGNSEYIIEGRNIFKNPITDDGTKISAKGLLQVVQDENGKLILKDECTWEEEAEGLLEVVFEDGKLIKETSLKEIREKVKNNHSILVTT